MWRTRKHELRYGTRVAREDIQAANGSHLSSTSLLALNPRLIDPFLFLGPWPRGAAQLYILAGLMYGTPSCSQEPMARDQREH